MSRKQTTENNEYYHVFNRGADKRNIFKDEIDYNRFLESLKYFNTKRPIFSIYTTKIRENFSAKTVPEALISARGTTFSDACLVDIIDFNLLPNHFHLILKQKIKTGIPLFMQKLGAGYTRYFNERYGKTGHLFQGPYRIKHLNYTEYYTWCRLYVRYNHLIHGMNSTDNLYSSLSDSSRISTGEDLLIDKSELETLIKE
ncbi:MAG: transposase, partial [Candidatus Komeilibacteria bacterium]|nr:transposase [Candidatus Komeilibacteria bacterium]